jgi:DNA-binding response OmpR family regulator
VPRPPSRNALVVEDDPAIRELLRPHLDLAGFTIAEAADGRRGLELPRSSSFDLMLLEVRLPGLDGETLCRAVPSGTPNAGVPILMLGARRRGRQGARARERRSLLARHSH